MNIKFTFGLFLWTFCFFYGIYIFISCLRENSAFIKSHKRIDLIKAWGNFGRLIYLLFGLAISTMSILMLLKSFGIGPFVGSK